jgi:hypothetical protein
VSLPDFTAPVNAARPMIYPSSATTPPVFHRMTTDAGEKLAKAERELQRYCFPAETCSAIEARGIKMILA